MATTQAFLPTANSTHAAILGVTTGMSGLPASMLPGLSGYIASKLAAAKALEFLASEHENIFVANVHPGIVDTEVSRKAGADPGVLPMDKGACLSFEAPCELVSSEALQGLIWIPS